MKITLVLEGARQNLLSRIVMVALSFLRIILMMSVNWGNIRFKMKLEDYVSLFFHCSPVRKRQVVLRFYNEIASINFESEESREIIVHESIWMMMASEHVLSSLKHPFDFFFILQTNNWCWCIHTFFFV